MKLEALLGTLARLASESGLPEPYIVGGSPRDRMLGLQLSQIKDIDLTTGDRSSVSLSLLASREIGRAHV